MTSGSRQSPSTPRVARYSNSRAGPRLAAARSTRSDSWQPRRSRFARRDDLQRVGQARADQRFEIAGQLASTSRASAPCRRARTAPATRAAAPAPRIGGLLSCQPSAPGVGTNSGPMRKRVAWSWPHQPAKRGRVGVRVALVHEAAGDRARARSSGTCSGTTRRSRRRCRAVAAAGCRRRAPGRSRRSRPARAPSRAISFRSKACPVRYCTPGHSTSARRGPCSAIARSIAAIEIVPSASSGSSSIRSVAGSKPWKRICDSTRVAIGRERAGFDQDRRRARAWAGRS